MIPKTEMAARELFQKLLRIHMESDSDAEMTALIKSYVGHSILRGSAARFLAIKCNVPPRTTAAYGDTSARSQEGMASLLIPALRECGWSVEDFRAEVEQPPSHIDHSDRLVLVDHCRLEEIRLGIPDEKKKKPEWWASAELPDLEGYKSYLSRMENMEEETIPPAYDEAPAAEEPAGEVISGSFGPSENEEYLMRILPVAIVSDPELFGTARLIYESETDAEAVSRSSWEHVKKIKHHLKPVHPRGIVLPRQRMDSSMMQDFIEAIRHTLINPSVLDNDNPTPARKPKRRASTEAAPPESYPPTVVPFAVVSVGENITMEDLLYLRSHHLRCLEVVDKMIASLENGALPKQ